MSTLQAITLDQVVDTDRYPLSDPDSTEARAVVARARRELAEVGCTVLPDFVRPELHGVLRQECAALAPHAYFDVETVNVYNIDVDADLPEDHPHLREHGLSGHRHPLVIDDLHRRWPRLERRPS